jgi:hypothetical protein
MRCEICGRGPKDGVTLHRQNAKGVDGIWRCDDHNTMPVDPWVARLRTILGPGVPFHPRRRAQRGVKSN